MKKSLVAIFLVSLTLTALVSSRAETRSDKRDIAANVSIFTSIIKELQSNYVDSIDMEKVVETGINAMLYKLDPYTQYFPVEQQKEFKQQNSGEYGGIGSYIMQRDGYVWISGPRAGSPAAKYGLRHGDKILEIDGEDMKGKTTEQVSDKLKGVPGTQVNVKILRPYVTDSIKTLNLVREKIQVPAVPYYGKVAGDLGYIQLNQYSEKSDKEVKEALEDLINNQKVKGLILDLRDNGGGYLESAVAILGYFLPKGTEVLRTKGKNIMEERVYKTPTKPIAPNIPLVVLTDDGTASASEITAGALQDLDRAVIMGQRTFGKGLVQSTMGLPYDGMLKVTTAKYYIPSGRLIQAIDYTHRAADGSATRIADSLTNEFKTAAGRIVRDGGGITPDIKVDLPEVSRITYNVVTGNWAFDFANKYAATHPGIEAPGTFEVTDSIYADFKNSIDPDKFEYDKVCEQALVQLRKLASIEGYMNDEVAAEIDRLENMMKHPLDKDLDTHRAAITPYVESEILERYFYDAGRIQGMLRYDEAFKQATELLHDSARYQSLLKPQKSK